MTSSDQFASSSRAKSGRSAGGNASSASNNQGGTAAASSSTSVTSKSHANKSHPYGKPPECYGCHKIIRERYLLKALDQVWHEDCLKCSCCNSRLGEIGSTLFTKADLILCKRDYLRMFGATGYCSSCNKQIPAFEMVMRARGNVYHLECFKCEACNHRFCVGDRFYLYENKILCEYDYEEQMTLSQMRQQQQQQQYYQSMISAPAGALSLVHGLPPSSHAEPNKSVGPGQSCHLAPLQQLECQASPDVEDVKLKNYSLKISPPSLGSSPRFQ